jgi:hypothetical protein
LQQLAPKAGIGQIVKFGPPFLVDIDRENFVIFKEYWFEKFFPSHEAVKT